MVSTSAFGQNNITDSVGKFNASCLKVIAPEDSIIPEFTLKKYHTTETTTLLNFEVVANSQINKGILEVLGDSLVINETNVRLVEVLKTIEIDSTGNTIEIVDETYITEIVFCNCVVNFTYELSTVLYYLNYMGFHGKTFRIG